MNQTADLTEKTLSREEKYQGSFLSLHVDQVQLPNGRTSFREVVEHVDGVAILALDDQNNVSLVKQFRYPFGKLLLELPAGKLGHGTGEAPLVGAKRELSEEAGLEAAHWTYLGCILASPGFSSEVLHMYLARQLTPTPRHPDEDEFLDVLTMPFDELFAQVMDGTVTDAKTVATVLKTKYLLGL